MTLKNTTRKFTPLENPSGTSLVGHIQMVFINDFENLYKHDLTTFEGVKELEWLWLGNLLEYLLLSNPKRLI